MLAISYHLNRAEFEDHSLAGTIAAIVEAPMAMSADNIANP